MAFTDIDDPTIFFNTVLYTGNASTRSITGVGFQPDWIWIKVRNYDNGHQLFDVVRGVTKRLQTNNTSAEATRSSSITSFDSDGFSMGADAQINDSASYTYSSWNWKAGGSASSNSGGSITSSVSANTTSGVSIVSYTGAGGSSNVGHGLGVAPNWIIAKNKDSSSLSWFVSNDVIGWTKRLKLEDTQSSATNSAFGDTNPDSTKFYLSGNNLNTSGEDHIAYCFAQKQGFSKFGKYIGNGNADGTFVFCGFKPAWVMIKPLATASWRIWDNKREDYDGNPNQTTFNANEDAVEYDNSSVAIDFLSNGFKARSSNSDISGSGVEYNFFAFAEKPFVNSKGIPNDAK